MGIIANTVINTNHIHISQGSLLQYSKWFGEDGGCSSLKNQKNISHLVTSEKSSRLANEFKKDFAEGVAQADLELIALNSGLLALCIVPFGALRIPKMATTLKQK